MTFDEAKTRLAEICAGIVQQNHELMDEMDKPDFDPAIQLDNTKNNAAYKLTDFFDILKAFPYGGVPTQATDALITTTDELLAKLRGKYGSSREVLGEIVRAGQAFRNSKRIWRIRNPIKSISQEEYEQLLNEACWNILRALDDLNYELNFLTIRSSPPAAKPPRKPVSITEAALALGVSKSTISNWEHGRCPVGLDYPGRADGSIFYFWARNYRSRKDFHRKAQMHAIHLNN